jgi:D-alanine transaminase
VSRVIYVNGRYQPYHSAAVHVEDRGFQFADSVYEVIEVLGGNLVDATRHLDRLERSLSELSMPAPMGRGALLAVIGQTLKRNRVINGLVYLQVSRGAGPRDFAFPSKDTPPTLVVIARAQQPGKMAATAETGISVITMQDMRWGRCDIKTVMLLPACLAKEMAKAAGAREVWFIDRDGIITEGASSNAWIITKDGIAVTRPLSHALLGGITRATAIDTLRGDGVIFEERPFSLDDALHAREAFLTSATNTIMPVIAIDGHTIGDGRPGAVTQRLRSRFHHFAEITAAFDQFMGTN